jgi:hypothetical protein
MEPRKVGRALGIGVRVASKMVQERVAAANAAPSENVAQPEVRRVPASSTASIGRLPLGNPGTKGTAEGSSPGSSPGSSWSAAMRRGLAAFWRAFLGPFTHAGSILWLEITGLFFALFAVFFLQSATRLQGSLGTSAGRWHLVLYVALVAGFGWFSASSFVRARRKSKRGPKR